MTTGSIATGQAVRLDLTANEALWSGRFDRLEVFRSRQTNAGPYEALCDERWSPARLPIGAVGDPSNNHGRGAALSGKTLELRINESVDLSITFTGMDPYSYANAAAVISADGAGLIQSFVLLDGTLIIETLAGGLAMTLRVVGGDAAPLLGLATIEPDSVAFGRDARIPLIHGKERYPFTDPNSASNVYYRTRYFNALSRETSGYSVPFQAPSIARLSAESLVRGTVDLVDEAGDPVAGRAVLVYLRSQGYIVEGKTVVGAPVRQVTDENGHAELMLPRGAAITVSIAGTDISRLIDIPTSPSVTSFDLLDPAYGTDDLFAVQRPNIAFAARRSL